MSKLRKKRTPQEKFKIVMEGLRGDHGSIAALCNAYGITQTDFYRWRDILMEDGSLLFERGGVGGDRHYEGASAGVTVHVDRRQGVEEGKNPGEAEGVLRAFQGCRRSGLNPPRLSGGICQGRGKRNCGRTRIGTDRHYFMGRPHCFSVRRIVVFRAFRGSKDIFLENSPFTPAHVAGTKNAPLPFGGGAF